MSQKVAVAIIHGIGKEVSTFSSNTEPEKLAAGMAPKLKSGFAKSLNLDENTINLIIEPVYWEPIFRVYKDELWSRIESSGKINDFFGMRKFIFDYLFDTFNYTNPENEIYQKINETLANTLKKLAKKAGQKAPLCLISQNLGSIITSNYMWDLQREKISFINDSSPLERGETLTLFYTLGSPIHLYCMLSSDCGTPIAVPSPKLANHYPGLEGEWINFYDRDDIFGYPMKNLNPKYSSVVTADQEVKIRNLLTGLSPLAHSEYWTNDEVNNTIAKSLAKVWISVNNEADTKITSSS